MADEAFQVEIPDLRTFIGDLKSVEPKLATGFRRELRHTGDEIIEAQKAILEGPKPGSVQKTGSKLRLIRPKNGRKPYFALRNEYEYGAEKTGGVPNLRKEIADGLKTRVVTGKTRQGVQIKTTGPRDDGYNMAKVWQKKLFRHPVFGSGTWMDQQGQPYFFGPVEQHAAEMRERIKTVVEDAVRSIQ